MKKIKLTESQLTDIISKVISEQYSGGIITEGDVPCDIWCKRKSAQRSSRGDVVKMIQNLLAKGCGDYGPYNQDNMGGGMNEGCIEDWANCDGKFERETKEAVKEFQEDAGLSVDGKVGYNTLSTLCSLCYGSASNIESAEYILCKKQCQCTEDQDVDGIQDVIDHIDCDGECDFDDWCEDGCDGDHWNNCERIKACLYYASQKGGEQWYHFLNCMRGKFGTTYN